MLRKEFKFKGLLDESVVYYISTLNDFVSLDYINKITVSDGDGKSLKYD